MTVRKRSPDELRAWLGEREGVAHRDDILRAGFALTLLRAFVRAGFASMIRRAWVALPDAPAELRVAASAGGRITCVTLARRRHWWVPAGLDPSVHLHLPPGSGSARLGPDWPGVTHWTRALAPVGRSLIGGVEDALAHIAVCFDRDTALVLWESAVRLEGLAPAALRTIPWRSLAARELADAVVGLSDSGLETLVVLPLRRLGLWVRQQVRIAGRPVDVVVGERLVLQIDGWEFHASAAQRTKDNAHDAELRLRGYTVVRVGYAQVVHAWPEVEAIVRRAVAAGLHRAA